jgi:hypothetical protein
MPQVSISQSALRELRERMSRHECPTGVRIMGPFEEDSRAPDSVEEAWLLEKLYGPPQRWVLEIVPLEEFQDEDMESMCALACWGVQGHPRRCSYVEAGPAAAHRTKWRCDSCV